MDYTLCNLHCAQNQQKWKEIYIVKNSDEFCGIPTLETYRMTHGNLTSLK